MARAEQALSHAPPGADSGDMLKRLPRTRPRLPCRRSCGPAGLRGAAHLSPAMMALEGDSVMAGGGGPATNTPVARLTKHAEPLQVVTKEHVVPPASMTGVGQWCGEGAAVNAWRWLCYTTARTQLRRNAASACATELASQPDVEAQSHTPYP